MGGNSSSSNSSNSNSVSNPSFRLELVPIPVWSHSPREQNKEEQERKEEHTQMQTQMQPYTKPPNNQHYYYHQEEKKEDPFGRTTGKRRAVAKPRLEEDPRRLPMVAAVFQELRRTDNILVTEIGRRGLLEYLQQGGMATTSISNSNSSCDEELLSCHCHCHSVCDWELQNDASFRYLMEVLQANMIYFLKRRYFDLERCRYHKHDHCNCNCDGAHGKQQQQQQQHHPEHDRRRTRSSIAEDFQTIFDKASSSRYLANRVQIAGHCFGKRHRPLPGDAKSAPRGDRGLTPETIQRALVRLHRRAGIFLPHTPARSSHGHPASANQHNHNTNGTTTTTTTTTAMEDAASNDDDAYWIDLWWVCSSILAAANAVTAPTTTGRRFHHRATPPTSSIAHRIGSNSSSSSSNRRLPSEGASRTTRWTRTTIPQALPSNPIAFPRFRLA